MKKNFLKTAVAFGCVAATAIGISAMTACDQQNELIVYTEAGFAPWEFTQEGSTSVVGVDMEIAKYIADKYDYKLTVINGNFDTIVAGIDEDNALGIAGISYSVSRAEAVEYSEFYWGSAYQAIVYVDGTATLTENEEFAVSNFVGSKLVYQTGTTSSLTVDENYTTWGATSKADFTQVMAALEEVTSAKSNTYLVVDSQVAAQLVSSNKTLKYAPIEGAEAEQYGVVAKKGNTALIEKVNAALDELLVKGTDGKNQIEKWYEQYSAIAPAD